MPEYVQRPPVVVILGHVDHGKSSLLEAIREEFKITATESGGITQHIGAYEVEHQGKRITFLDTPGHEAFSAMRSRGAKVADIAILVVAADEGVKQQTKEAASHAVEAKLPMIVAVNKMDKEGANLEKVKGELAKEGIFVEGMGGEIMCVPTSAVTKQGIPELLDAIVLLAEVTGVKAPVSAAAKGLVIESKQDPKRGATATVLLREGVLRVGDIIATETVMGKVKALENFQGVRMEEQTASVPAFLVGFDARPNVGEEVRGFSSLAEAKEWAEGMRKTPVVMRREDMEDEEKPTLSVVVKADVAGSLEAVVGLLKRMEQETTVLRILKADVGEVNETDIRAAQGEDGLVVAFRVKTPGPMVRLAERMNVRIETFDIIYKLEERVKEVLQRTGEPEIARVDTGSVKILAVFKTEGARQVIGGKVETGEARKGSVVEVVRNEEVVGTGKIVNLQRAKKDATVAPKGEETGMLYEGLKVEVWDTLVFFREEKRKF